MDHKLHQDSDYCDLEPGKVCDNCCKCLDMEKPYNEIDVGLTRTDRIDDEDMLALPLEFYEEEDACCSDDAFDPSRVAPIEIDPALMAEWESRLRAYEAEEKMAHMRTLHGTRKRPEKK